MRRRFCIFLLLVVAAGTTVAEPASPLLDLVRERNAAIESIVRSPTEGETPEERAQIKSIVAALFDFQRYSELSLGRYWKERTAEERIEFTDLCRRLIERNYADPQLYKKADRVDYIGAEQEEDEGSVETVVHYKTEQSTITYQLRRQADTWLIYDMVIDDLSVARSNRSQFRKEIRKSSYEGLVKKLRDKLEQQEDEKP
jgi:phospholipid transport system substrate-binding protein